MSIALLLVSVLLPAKTVKKYKKHDKYIQAVANLYEEDMEVRKTEENTDKTKKKNRRTKWKLGQKKKTN